MGSYPMARLKSLSYSATSPDCLFVCLTVTLIAATGSPWQNASQHALQLHEKYTNEYDKRVRHIPLSFLPPSHPPGRNHGTFRRLLSDLRGKVYVFAVKQSNDHSFCIAVANKRRSSRIVWSIWWFTLSISIGRPLAVVVVFRYENDYRASSDHQTRYRAVKSSDPLNYSVRLGRAKIISNLLLRHSIWFYAHFPRFISFTFSTPAIISSPISIT